MTPLKELKKLAESATPGPWVSNNQGAVRTSSGDETTRGRARWQGVFKQQDADFIAKANPATVLEMIAVMEQMELCVKSSMEYRLGIPVFEAALSNYNKLNGEG